MGHKVEYAYCWCKKKVIKLTSEELRKGITGSCGAEECIGEVTELKPSVSIEEIDEQRRLGWPDFHPEDYCHRCGGRNPVWWVDSDRFNMAFGPPEQHPYNGIVCPGCFVEAHERATGLRTVWKLTPDPTIHFRPVDDGEEGGAVVH